MLARDPRGEFRNRSAIWSEKMSSNMSRRRAGGSSPGKTSRTKASTWAAERFLDSCPVKAGATDRSRGVDLVVGYEHAPPAERGWRVHECLRAGTRRVIGSSDPERYRLPLARALYDLGQIQLRTGLRQEGVTALRESAQLCLEESAMSHSMDGWFIDRALPSLGSFLSTLGLLELALPLQVEAVRRRRDASTASIPVAPERETYTTGIAVSVDRLASGLRGMDPRHQDLPTALMSLVKTLRALRRDAEALPLAIEAVGIYERFTAADSSRRIDLASALTELGALYRATSWPAEAVSVYRKAAFLYRAFASVDSDASRDFADALAHLAVALDDVGNHDEASSVRKEADLYGRGAR
jgi:tetratricopeptide (TPR) repeat protein